MSSERNGKKIGSSQIPLILVNRVSAKDETCTVMAFSFICIILKWKIIRVRLTIERDVERNSAMIQTVDAESDIIKAYNEDFEHIHFISKF